MSAGYTAGVAKITIRPDLKGFRNSLKRQVSKYLQGYTLKVDADTKDAERVAEQWRNHMRRIGDESAKALGKAFSDNKPKLDVDPRNLTKNLDKANKAIKRHGQLQTETQRQIAQSIRDTATARDKQAGKVKTSENNTLNAFRSVKKAEKRLADYAASGGIDSAKVKEFSEDIAAATRRYQNHVETLRSVRHEASKLKREQKSLAAALTQSMTGPQDAAAAQSKLQRDAQNMANSIAARYKRNNQATAQNAVDRLLQQHAAQNDRAAKKLAGEFIMGAKRMDDAANDHARTLQKVQDATSDLADAQRELNEIEAKFSDDPKRMSRAQRRLDDAQRSVREAKDAEHTADIDALRAQTELQELQRRFNNAAQFGGAHSAALRQNAIFDVNQLRGAIDRNLKAIQGFHVQRAAIDAQQILGVSSLSDISNDTDRRNAERYLRSAGEMERADRERTASLRQVEMATRGAELAEMKHAQVLNDYPNDAVKAAEADLALARARNALTEATERDLLVATKRQEVQTRHRVDRNVLSRGAPESRGAIPRMLDSLDSMVGNLFQRMGERMLLAGRMLSAFTQIATTAAVALASIGAVNLVPLIGSLSSIGSLLGLIPALASGAAAAIAAIAVGSNGIVEAFKAATKMSDNADKDAKQRQDQIKSARKQQESAARSYENAIRRREDAVQRQADAVDELNEAQRSAERTAVDGARSIANADKEVVRSKEAAVDAEKSLSQARKDAARTIRDLNDAQKEGSLSEEEALLGVQRARERMFDTRWSSDASVLDKREANVGVRRALLNLDQVRKRNTELREEVADANRLGVEGSEGVVAAQRNARDAAERVVDAEQSLVDTRENVALANERAAKQIVNAERSIKDANQGVVDAERDIADATEAIAEANEKLAEAVSSSSSSADEFAKAMEKLSPAGRKFVETARGLGDAWTDVRKATQESLFTGLDTSLLKASTLLDPLKEGLSGVAEGISQNIKAVVNEMTTPQAKNDLSHVFDKTSESVGILTGASRALSEMWMDLSTVGANFLPRIAQGLSDLLSRWADKIDEMRKDGSLERMFERGIEIATTFGRIVGNVFTGVKNVFKALQPMGDEMLGSIESLTERFVAFTESPEGREKIQDFFARARDLMNDVWNLVSSLSTIFTENLLPAIQTVSSFTMPFLQLMFDVLNGMGPLIQTVALAFLAWKIINPVIGGLNTGLDRMKTYLFFGGMAIQGYAQTARDQLQQVRGHVQTTEGRFKLFERTVGGAVNGAQKALSGLIGYLGGFWGAGIMAAVAVIGAFSAAKANAARETEKLTEKEKEFQRTLDKRSGIATRQTQEEAVSTLQDGGWLDRAEGFGINKQDLVDGMIGNSAATGKIVGRLKADIKPALLNSASWQNNKDAYIDMLGPNAADIIASAMAGDRNAEDTYNRAKSAYFARPETNRKLNLPNWNDFRRDFGQGSAAESAKDLGQEFLKNQTSVVDGGPKAREANELLEGGPHSLSANGSQVLQKYNLKLFHAGAANEIVAEGSLTGDQIKELRKYGISATQQPGNMVKLVSDGTNAAGDDALDLAFKNGTQDTTVGKPRFDAPPPSVDGAPAPAPTFDSTDAMASATDSLNMSLAEAESLTAVGQDVPGAVTQVPMVDYQPSLTAFSTYGDQIQKIFAEKIQPGFTKLIEEHGKLGTSMESAIDGIVGAYDRMVQKLIEVQDNIAQVGPRVEAAASLSVPALDRLIGKVTEVRDSFNHSITQGMVPNLIVLNGEITKTKDHWADQISNNMIPRWESLERSLQEKILIITGGHFRTLRSALDEVKIAFGGTVTGIGVEWTKIKKSIAEPINWVITEAIGRGLKDSWNAVRAVVPDLQEWKVDVTPITGYHTGGIMSGYSPGRDDRIIAVGGGEAVMRPEWVRAVGANYINTANAAARQGGIGGVKNFLGAFNQGGIVDSMTDVVRERFPMMTMTSGLRFTDNGYHSKGMAADFSNGGVEGTPEMKELAGWIAANWQDKTIQLIHRPFGHNIGDGKFVGNGDQYYTPGTMEEHRHHVHWAAKEPLDGRPADLPALAGGVTDGASFRRVMEAFNKPLDDVKNAMPKFGESMFGTMPGKTLEELRKQARKTIEGAAAKFGSLDMGNTPWDISAGVEQWHDNIVAALIREGFEPSERNIMLTKRQMQTESGGNPNIVQQVQDVNSGGNEAVGAMQVIPGTFASFRNPDLPNDRTNVDASLSAALRWYRHAYGDDLGVMWGKGHGYDQGGWLEHGGLGINMSGKPEPVFTANQWLNIKGLIEAVEKMKPQFDAMLQGAEKALTRTPDPAPAAEEPKPEDPNAPPPAEWPAEIANNPVLKALWEANGITTADEYAAQYSLEAQQAVMPTAEDYKQRFEALGKGFLGAQLDQFKSDIGFQGNGALSVGYEKFGRVIEEHIHYHVADMDEAIRKETTRRMQEVHSFFQR